MRRLAKEELIAKAVVIHKNKYTYDNFIYANTSTKSFITCPDHGDFLQDFEHHLAGNGCPACGGRQALTLEIVIERSNKVHNNKYIYDKLAYVNVHTTGIIGCPIHGYFEQEIKSHLHGYGCRECAFDKNRERANLSRTTKEEFVNEGTTIHDGKYTYDNFIYTNIHEKSYITCKDHGDFLQSATVHIHQKCGCPRCGIIEQTAPRTHTKDIFIEKAIEVHGNKFDYSLVNYINMNTYVSIICNTCKNIFNQTPDSHLGGDGCPECSIRKKKDTPSFIEAAKNIHGNLYDYSLVDYVNSTTRITIICSIHGNFLQTPVKHLMGRGCQDCTILKNERIVRSVLDDFNIKYISQYNIHLSNAKYAKRVDYYLPDHNLIIEYNGQQHYGPVRFNGQTKKQADQSFETQKQRDAQIRQYCSDNNINLLEIDGRKYKNEKLKKFVSEQLTTLC